MAISSADWHLYERMLNRDRGEEFWREVFGNDIDDGRIIPTWIKNENIHALSHLHIAVR